MSIVTYREQSPDDSGHTNPVQFRRSLGRTAVGVLRIQLRSAGYGVFTPAEVERIPAHLVDGVEFPLNDPAAVQLADEGYLITRDRRQARAIRLALYGPRSYRFLFHRLLPVGVGVSAVLLSIRHFAG